MSPMLFVILALGGSPDSPGDTAPASPAAAEIVKKESPSRTGAELREAVHQAMRRWAQPSDPQADAAAREFLALYRELQTDKQLSFSQREYLVGKLRIRLDQLSDQIAKRVAREKRLAQNKAAKSSTEFASASLNKPSSNAVAIAATSTGAFGGGALGPSDHGQELVDLIQQVIHPTSWDVNGGPGSIYYWYPGKALVIRQTDDMHEQIGDVLEQLRRVGN